MEDHNAEEDKSKEEFREEFGVDPDDLLDTVRRFMDLYKKFILLQFPLTNDLKESLKELFEKQYPEIKPYTQIWHVNWVFEAMEFAAQSVAIEMVNFFEKLEKGEDYKERYTDYDQFVRLYSKPYEPYKVQIDYDKLRLNDEQLRIYESVVEESYQDSVKGTKELNQKRDEYLNLLHSHVLSYFEEEFEALTTDERLHYDIIAGMGWESYFDECRELNSYLITHKMQEYPGMGYGQFLQKQCEKLREESTQRQQSQEK